MYGIIRKTQAKVGRVGVETCTDNVTRKLDTRNSVTILIPKNEMDLKKNVNEFNNV